MKGIEMKINSIDFLFGIKENNGYYCNDSYLFIEPEEYKGERFHFLNNLYQKREIFVIEKDKKLRKAFILSFLVENLSYYKVYIKFKFI